MKNAVYILLILIMGSCVGSKYLMEQGRYDEAITHSVKKLQKNPENKNEIDIMLKSYTIANESDINEIKTIDNTGSPARWPQILNIYNALNNRQILIQPALKQMSTEEKSKFVVQDYSQTIAGLKNKTSEYFYTYGTSLLLQNNMFRAREAYNAFCKSEEYVKDTFPNIQKLKDEATKMGTSCVTFAIKNNTSLGINTQLAEMDIIAHLNNPTGLQSLLYKPFRWVKFYKESKIEERKNDYDIYFEIVDFKLSPLYTNENRTCIKATVEDGFEYVLDKKGNVAKDTLGNDIKVVKYKEVTCDVVVYKQTKSAEIYGFGNIYDYHVKSLIQQFQISGDDTFVTEWHEYQGDTRALKNYSGSFLPTSTSPDLPPSDHYQLLKCTDKIMDAIEYSTRKNIKYLGGD